MRNRKTRLLWAGLFFVCLAGTAFCADAPARGEYTGDFILNREMPVNLSAGTAEHPRLVEVSWVRVEPVYGNAWVAMARVGWSPVADATWRIKVELLDDKGQVLRHSRDRLMTFTGKADGTNQDAMQYAEVNLDAMQWENRRHAALLTLKN